MKKEKKSLLIALVIGDGYIRKDKRVKKPVCSLKMCHSEKQLSLLEYKVSLLHSLVGGKRPTINRYIHKWPDGQSFVQYRSEKAHSYFRVLHNWMYPDKYNKNVMKHLTPQGIAIWYMDDGSIAANNRDKDGSCRTARTHIHTCTTLEKAAELCEYFLNTWGIKFTVFRDGKNTWSIRCFHVEGRKFHELIHPFIIPSMIYKQRFYYDTSA